MAFLPLAAADLTLAVVVALAAVVLQVVILIRVLQLGNDLAETRRLVADLLEDRLGIGSRAPANAVAPEPSSRPPVAEAITSQEQLAGGHRVMREAGAKPSDPWRCRDCEFTSRSRAAARAHRIATGARSLVSTPSSLDEVVVLPSEHEVEGSS